MLSDNWYVLRKITYEYFMKDGSRQVQSREAYDRGNGATILLYNREQKTAKPLCCFNTSNCSKYNRKNYYYPIRIKLGK